MEIMFVDWVPIVQKSSIRSGNHIKRYYAYKTLRKMVDTVIPFRKKNGKINSKSVKWMFKKDTRIWVEYGCGRIAHLCVLFASFLCNKKIILDINDFAIQQKYIDNIESRFLKRLQLKIIEKLLLYRADTIILPCPGLLDYFTPRKNQRILIMPPGVGEDEFSGHQSCTNNGKNIALYFGSMQRKDAIPRLVELFSKLNDWKLHLVGLKDGVKFVENQNVVYLGTVNHDALDKIMQKATVILIPVPKNDYLDKAMHIKMGYALKSCKPIIATKLSGILDYVSMLGLDENLIYLQEWNIESLEEALRKAQDIIIDPEKTIKIMKSMAWESRYKKAVEISLGTFNMSYDIEWV